MNFLYFMSWKYVHTYVYTHLLYSDEVYDKYVSLIPCTAIFMKYVHISLLIIIYAVDSCLFIYHAINYVIAPYKPINDMSMYVYQSVYHGSTTFVHTSNKFDLWELNTWSIFQNGSR